MFQTDVSVDMPDFMDLNWLRGTGLQVGEEELPDLTPPIVIPEDTRGNPSILFYYSFQVFLNF